MARQDRLRQNIVAVTNHCTVQRVAANLAQSTGSGQCSSLLTFRRHQLHFYVVPRKLIPKLQAFSQCIQETSMVRFYSSIHSDDEMLIRQMSYDSAFHGNPQPKSPPQIERKDRMSRQRSRRSKTKLIRVEIVLLFDAMRCCGNAARLMPGTSCAPLLEGTPDVRQGLRFLRAELPRPLTKPPDMLSPRMVGSSRACRGVAPAR